MGTTVLLSQLSAMAELLVIDLVTQQDPESDPQLANHAPRIAFVPQSLLEPLPSRVQHRNRLLSRM
jgi:hypothetical protein